MMTKAQEREALKRIANLIDAAGPDSYIGMAFAGCVEIAADNIENDFGNSLKDELERVKRSRDELAEARRRSDEHAEALAARLEAARAELTQQAEALKAARIPAGLYKRLWLAVEAQHAEAVHAMNCSADLLAEMVNAPGDIAVAQCLKTLKKQKTRREEAAALLADLEKIAPAGC